MNLIANSADSKSDFSGVEDLITFPDSINTNKITIEQPKISQEDFNKYLKLIGKKLKNKVMMLWKK